MQMLAGVGSFSSRMGGGGGGVGVCAGEKGPGFNVFSLNQRLQFHYLGS